MTLVNRFGSKEGQTANTSTRRAEMQPAEESIFRIKSGTEDSDSTEFSATKAFISATLIAAPDTRQLKEREKIKAEKLQIDTEYYQMLEQTRQLNDKAATKLQQTLQEAAKLWEKADSMDSKEKTLAQSNALLQNCLMTLDSSTPTGLVAQYVANMARINHKMQG